MGSSFWFFSTPKVPHCQSSGYPVVSASNLLTRHNRAFRRPDSLLGLGGLGLSADDTGIFPNPYLVLKTVAPY